MNKWRLGLLGFLIISMEGAFMPAMAKPGWKLFISKKEHYSVHYPAWWRRIQSDSDFLYIVNFPKSAKIKVLAFPPGGAEIVVQEAKEHYNSIDEWIKKDSRYGAKVIGRHVMKQPKAQADACATFVQVVTKTDIGLPARFIGTSYYCSVQGHLFVIELGNWEWDSRQKQLQMLALKIARSLRISQ